MANSKSLTSSWNGFRDLARRLLGRVPTEAPALYARANIYVGRYRVPSNGHIRLPKARIRLLRGTVTDQGWMEDVNGDPWLILEDGGFWPVMYHLQKGEDSILSNLIWQMTATAHNTNLERSVELR